MEKQENEFPQLDKLIEWFIDNHSSDDNAYGAQLLEFINDILKDYKNYKINKLENLR